MLGKTWLPLGWVILTILAAGRLTAQAVDEDKLRQAQEKLREGKEADDLELLTMRESMPPAEWLALFAASSTDFVCAGKPVENGTDKSELDRLAASSTPEIQFAAAKLVRVVDLESQLKDEGNISGLIAPLQAQMAYCMLRTAFDDNYNGQLLMNDLSETRSALGRLQAKLQNCLSMEKQKREVLLEEQRQIVTWLRSRQKEEIDAFPRQFVPARFKVSHPDNVTLTLSNLSPKTLHHCVFFSHGQVDVNGLQELRNQQSISGSLGQLFMVGMGADPRFAQRATDIQQTSWDIHLMDSQMVAYLEEWQPQATVEVGLAPASKAYHFQSADWSMWSDEGYSRGEINVDALRQAILKEFKPVQTNSPRPKTPIRHTSAPPAPEYHPTIHMRH